MRVKTIWVILTLAVLTAGIMLSLQKFRQTEGRKRAFCVYTYEAGCAQTNRIIKTAARSSPRMGNYQDPSVILRDDVEEFLSRMPKTLLANEFAKCTLSDCCEEKDAAVFESLTFETTPGDPTAKVSVSAKSEEYALTALKFTMRHFDEFVEMKRRMRNENAIAHLRYKMKQMERKCEDILSISNLINETWAVVDACGNRVCLIVPPTCAK